MIIRHMTIRIISVFCGLIFRAGITEIKAFSVQSKSSSTVIVTAEMHNPSYSNAAPTCINIKTVNNKNGERLQEQVNLAELIKDKIMKHEKFYGIEISARSKEVLDYQVFKVQPLFTSVVWIGDIYANIEPISEAPAIKCAQYLRKSEIVLPHITCYNMTKEKLDQFPLDDFKNVLVLRGDTVNQSQNYKYAVELVREIRSRRKDISIAVGGYPEVHPTASSKEEDLQYLKEKVDAGADMIVTQLSFSSTRIIDFIKDCRRLGIKVPIIPGIFIPKNFSSLNLMCRVTKVCPPEDDLNEYKRLENDEQAFQEYSLQKAKSLIRSLFESDVQVYGVQFFSFNYFDNIGKIVDEFFS